MREIVEALEKILKKDKADVRALLAFLVEEVGEVAVGINVDEGFKNRKLDEPTPSECADVILCALAIMIKYQYNTEDIKNTIKKKLAKWEKKV